MAETERRVDTQSIKASVAHEELLSVEPARRAGIVQVRGPVLFTLTECRRQSTRWAHYAGQDVGHGQAGLLSEVPDLSHSGR